MNKSIRVNRKLGKLKAKIFCLCGLSIRKMTAFFFGLWLASQGISASIEFLIWGELFTHIGDSIITLTLSVMYIYYSQELGDLLLDLQFNEEVEKS